MSYWQHRLSSSGPAWLACLVVGLALLTLAVVLDVERSSATGVGQPVPLVNVGRLSYPTAAGAGIHSASRTAARDTSSLEHLPAGARVRLVRLGLDAAITTVTAVANVMRIPRDPRIVGWWSGGSVPGNSRGSAVIVGHINFAATTGALAVLPRARPGDTVVVTASHVHVRYRVIAIRSYPKSVGIPAAVFSRTGPAQLVLITCGGSFDKATGNYRDNIVVFARPI